MLLLIHSLGRCGGRLQFCGKSLIVLHFDVQAEEPLHQQLCLWAAAIMIFKVAAVPANPVSIDRLCGVSHLDVPRMPFQVQLLLHF
jgi:hypothetical protein